MVCGFSSTLVHSLLCVENCSETKKDLGRKKVDVGALRPGQNGDVNSKATFFFFEERFGTLGGAMELRFKVVVCGSK
jgi:hypothetical protein